MHRRRLLKTAGIAAASTIAAPAVLRAQSPEIKWRCASSFPKTLDVLYGTAEEIGRRVAAATDNKFQIRVSAGGELVPGLQVLDAVQNETVECGHSASYYYVGKDPTFAFDTAIPFGLNARAHNAWMYAGGGFDLMRALFKDYTIVQFPAGNTGAQMGGWFRKELKSVDDLRGLKIRIAGFAGQVLARLGAVPQQIGGAGLYPALEKGTIDAAEFVGPYDDDKLGLVKVAPYYYYPGFWEPGAQLSFYVNAKPWESLPPQYQAAIDSACAAANTLMLAKYDARNPSALRRLVGQGAVLRPFPRDLMLAAYRASAEVIEETAAGNATFKRVLESWSKFREEEDLWFRVAENTMDNFLYAQAAARK